MGTAYMDKCKASKKVEVKLEAVFPCMLQIDKVFRQKEPMLFGCTVIDGQLRPGTPICVPERDCLEIGRVGGIEKEKGKQLPVARRGDQVCVKIDQKNKLVSLISRQSIDTLKDHFRDEMTNEDWALVA